MRLKLGVVVSAAGILVGSVLVIAVLNGLYFRSFLIDSADLRLLATATSVRSVFGQALAMGLPLREFDGGKRVIDDVLRTDPDIRAVTIYEPDGDHYAAVVGSAPARTPLPDAWRRAMARDPAAQSWQITDAEGFGVLVPIFNAFNKISGVAAFIQSPATIVAERQRFDRFIELTSLWVTLPILLLVIPAAIWAVRPLPALLPRWTRFTGDFARAREARTPPPAPPRQEGEDCLADILAAPYALLRQQAAESQGSPGA
jgi:hypothetical protein